MSAEDAAAAHEESLYHTMNERAFYRVTAGIHRAVDGSLPRTVVEQAQGMGSPIITEGLQLPSDARAHYQDWYSLEITPESAVTVAESENNQTRAAARIGIRIALETADLQDQIFSDRFALSGNKLKPFPEDLNQSRFTAAAWRQARLRVSGGRLAICENVSLDDGKGSLTRYYGVEIHDNDIHQQLSIIPYYRGIFHSTYTITASQENPDIRNVAQRVVSDPVAVYDLLSMNAKSERDVVENIRAFMLRRKLAKEEWAQDMKTVGEVAGILVEGGLKVYRARKEEIVVVNGHEKARPEKLHEIGVWLGGRLYD
jgi:hypothetical protein